MSAPDTFCQVLGDAIRQRAAPNEKRVIAPFEAYRDCQAGPPEVRRLAVETLAARALRLRVPKDLIERAIAVRWEGDR